MVYVLCARVETRVEVPVEVPVEDSGKNAKLEPTAPLLDDVKELAKEVQPERPRTATMMKSKDL